MNFWWAGVVATRLPPAFAGVHLTLPAHDWFPSHWVCVAYPNGGARKGSVKPLANFGGKGLERPNLRRSMTYMRRYTTFPWRGRKDSHLHLQVRCGTPDGLKLTYSPKNEFLMNSIIYQIRDWWGIIPLYYLLEVVSSECANHIVLAARS